jgi:hypothetical protein
MHSRQAPNGLKAVRIPSDLIVFVSFERAVYVPSLIKTNLHPGSIRRCRIVRFERHLLPGAAAALGGLPPDIVDLDIAHDARSPREK